MQKVHLYKVGVSVCLSKSLDASKKAARRHLCREHHLCPSHGLGHGGHRRTQTDPSSNATGSWTLFHSYPSKGYSLDLRF